jgi:mono/diheme cytochrome c family protein
MTLNWLKALTTPRFQGLMFLMLLSFTITQPIYAQEDAVDMELVKKGKELFKGNCAACHNAVKDMTGPKLEGVSAKWAKEVGADFKGKTSKEWLYEWIRNTNTPVAAGLPYAIKMIDYDPSVMQLNLSLSDEDIKAILYYADNSTAGQIVVAENVVSEDNGDAGLINWFLGFLILALLIAAFALAKVSEKLKKAAVAKTGIVETEGTPFLKSSLFKTLAKLAVTIVIVYLLASQAIALGRQQNYQPMQPIKYSHALHAGEYEIDCKYCHTGAVESKHSNIPSSNVCMNCHKMIQEGPKHGRKEIAKIYAAIGYNPIKGTYFDLAKTSKKVYTKAFKKFLAKDHSKDEAKVNQKDLDAVTDMFNKPVEWVRVHNLPDHVYFNHAQHVNAGNVECQTCHGDIQNMEVVKQHAPLSMGWCINCHRETNIDLGNEYYRDFKELHKKGSATVEDIGGTDCQKCHY